jgi:hypothetical protein
VILSRGGGFTFRLLPRTGPPSDPIRGGSRNIRATRAESPIDERKIAKESVTYGTGLNFTDYQSFQREIGIPARGERGEFISSNNE